MLNNNNTKPRKLKLGKFGLAENPLELYCQLDYKGRSYLGTIKGVRFDQTLGKTFLKVRHFNGEPWPFEPHVLAVNILDGQPLITNR